MCPMSESTAAPLAVLVTAMVMVMAMVTVIVTVVVVLVKLHGRSEQCRNKVQRVRVHCISAIIGPSKKTGLPARHPLRASRILKKDFTLLGSALEPAVHLQFPRSLTSTYHSSKKSVVCNMSQLSSGLVPRPFLPPKTAWERGQLSSGVKCTHC